MLLNYLFNFSIFDFNIYCNIKLLFILKLKLNQLDYACTIFLITKKNSS